MFLRRFDVLVAAAWACVGALAAPAAAGTMTFDIDVDAAVDSRDPNHNFGVSTSVKVVVNGDDGSLVRTLFALPEEAWTAPNADVTSARVWFYTWRNATADRTVRLHVLTRDFVEGTGDHTVSGDGATWATHDGTGAWASPGGDHDASLWADAVELAGAGAGGWFYWDITALWDEAALRDHGALLRMADESAPGSGNMPRAAFTSSDGPAGERPYVELVTVPEPASLAVLAGIMLGGLAGKPRGRRTPRGAARPAGQPERRP
jgi:hypothetical protein